MASAARHTPYQRFLERLSARERYEPTVRSRGKEKLAGILSLLGRLGHPERAFRVVHVAGTNGKGMTAAMVARLLAAEGMRVGVYASPHVLDIRERISIAGRPIAKREFREAGEAVLDAAAALEARQEAADLSYFDLLTAMGFLAFQRGGVEWGVLEVGLGGFSDATNTTDKELCILTRLGLDHMAVLGTNLREIAEQKLGILRPGVPIIVAPQPEALRPWLAGRIRELGGAPVFVEPPACRHPPRARKAAGAPPWPNGRIPAPRLACAATALAAAEALLGPARGAALRARWRRALHTPLPGRLEYRERLAVKGHQGPPFRAAVLDGGHNESALQALADQLKLWDVTGYTLIFGMQRDKLSAPVHAPLRKLFGGARQIVTMAPQTPRAPTTEELRLFVREVMAGARPPPLASCANPREALLEAARRPERPLVVSGSFWMLGDLMAHLEPVGRRGGRPRKPAGNKIGRRETS